MASLRDVASRGEDPSLTWGGGDLVGRHDTAKFVIKNTNFILIYSKIF